LLYLVIWLHIASWVPQNRILDPLIPRHVSSGPVTQVQAPDTRLVPTRKIGSLVGTRSGRAGGYGGSRRSRIVQI